MYVFKCNVSLASLRWYCVDVDCNSNGKGVPAVSVFCDLKMETAGISESWIFMPTSTRYHHTETGATLEYRL